MVALFFNMNHIWEAYLLRTLQRLAPPDWAVRKPTKVVFWQAPGQQSRMQPDILLQHAAHGTIILDAKWKRPDGRHAENDLRQLFAYAHHFEATQVRLLYPQAGQETAVEGVFTRPLVTAGGAGAQDIRCGVSYIRVGQRTSDIAAVTAIDINLITRNLRCSIGEELPIWLQT